MPMYNYCSKQISYRANATEALYHNGDVAIISQLTNSTNFVRYVELECQ